jgi:hypothetical protein
MNFRIIPSLFVTQHFESRCASLIEAIDQTDDQPLRKASNNQNAMAATARTMITFVLMSHLTLKIEVIRVGRPSSQRPIALKSAGGHR